MDFFTSSAGNELQLFVMNATRLKSRIFDLLMDQGYGALALGIFRVHCKQ